MYYLIVKDMRQIKAKLTLFLTLVSLLAVVLAQSCFIYRQRALHPKGSSLKPFKTSRSIPIELLIAIRKRMNVSFPYAPSGIEYSVYNLSDTEASVMFFLKSEKGNIPFATMDFVNRGGNWALSGLHGWYVPSPSKDLEILGFKMRTTYVNNTEVLDYVSPTIKNTNEYPAYVACVEVELESSNDRYYKRYYVSGHLGIMLGIIGPNCKGILHPSSPPILPTWYSRSRSNWIYLKVDSLSGRTFVVIIRIKDKEGTVLASRAFVCSFRNSRDLDISPIDELNEKRMLIKVSIEY